MAMRLARLLPALVLSCLFALPLAARADEQLTLDARTGLNAFAALVDQHLTDIRNGLRLLAATEDAASGQWNRIKGPLAQFSKDEPNDAAMWFARPDGSYYTVEQGLTKQNLKDRDYFPRLMAGKEVAGDLVISKSTGVPAAIFAMPLLSKGHVVGAIGVSLSMAQVSSRIDQAVGFPKQVMFYALDGNGQIALHREAGLLFEFAADKGDPSVAAAVKTMLSQPEGVVHYKVQGTDRTAIFKRSTETGWVYALRW